MASGSSLLQPPPTNRGVERTRDTDGAESLSTGTVALIDTVSCTFRDSAISQADLLEKVKCLLSPAEDFDNLPALAGIGGAGWEETPRGRNGYSRGLMRGYVSLWWGGSDDMGVFLHITGQGCRQLEAEGVIENTPESPFGWVDFLDSCRCAGGRFSRLDVALDDTSGLLDIHVIESHRKNRFFVARMEQNNYHESSCTVAGHDGPIVGRTSYFGGKNSPSQVRFYDKRAERLVAGENIADLPEHWVRCELQTREDRADNLAGWLIHQGVAGVSTVLRALVSFRTPTEDTNKRRWPIAEWWAAFLGECESERVTLATKPEVKSLSRSLDWFRRQYSAVLAVAVRASGYGINWISEVIAEGEVNLKRSAHRYRSRLEMHEAGMHRAGARPQHSELPLRSDRWLYDTGDSRAIWSKILGTRPKMQRLLLPFEEWVWEVYSPSEVVALDKERHRVMGIPYPVC